MSAAGEIGRSSMSPTELRLLRRVAERDACFRNFIHSPAERERCDAEVRELQKLERKGWLTLQWHHMSHHGEVYAAEPLISQVGQRALADCAGVG